MVCILSEGTVADILAVSEVELQLSNQRATALDYCHKATPSHLRYNSEQESVVIYCRNNYAQFENHETKS
jgi:hypothetical protein